VSIRVWIDGGWAVDALLGRQLRAHKDLDIALERSDVGRLREILATTGFRKVREDGEWNFVLADDEGHEIDVHVFVCDEQGNVVDGIRYPPESLTGTGSIDGHIVRCISAKHMVAFLAPWIHKWPDKYVPAVSALCEKFGIELPTEYIEFTRSRPGARTAELLQGRHTRRAG
jgi:lincosamide nucleotidyltransferase A/C/D/E